MDCMPQEGLPFPPLPPKRPYLWKLALVAALLVAALLVAGLVFVRIPRENRVPSRRHKVTKAISDMDIILRAADFFHATTGRDSGSLREQVDAKDKDGQPINTLEKFPLDPWGREYRYEILDGSPRVTCLGKDGVEG